MNGPLDPHGDGTLRPGDPVFDATMRGSTVFGNQKADGSWDLKETPEEQATPYDHAMGLLDKLERGIKPEPGEYATRKEWLLVGLFITVILAIILFVAAMILWAPTSKAEPGSSAAICVALDQDPEQSTITEIVLDRYFAGENPEAVGEDIARQVMVECPDYVPLLMEWVHTWVPGEYSENKNNQSPFLY